MGRKLGWLSAAAAAVPAEARPPAARARRSSSNSVVALRLHPASAMPCPAWRHPGVSSGPRPAQSPDTAAGTAAGSTDRARPEAPGAAKAASGYRGYRDEFWTRPPRWTPLRMCPLPPTAGGQGAGTLGFAGTAPTTSGAAAGMVQCRRTAQALKVRCCPTWTTDAEQ